MQTSNTFIHAYEALPSWMRHGSDALVCSGDKFRPITHTGSSNGGELSNLVRQITVKHSACSSQCSRALVKQSDRVFQVVSHGLVTQRDTALLCCKKPIRLKFSQLVDAQFRDVFTPLRDSRQGDVENFGQLCCIASQSDCGFCLHGITLAHLSLASLKPYSLLKYLEGLIKL